MTIPFLDRCIFNPVTGTTADFVVSNAVIGYMTPASANARDGQIYHYAAQTVSGTAVTSWEVGLGTYATASSTQARTTVLYSSNSNNKVNFATTPQVMITALAGDFSNYNITRSQIPNTTITAETFEVKGFSTAGDLGIGATYTSVAATAGSPMAIQDAKGTWFRLVPGEVINAGWFGAKGDGITNDTAAIQAALNFCFPPNVFANAKLYFPAGTYNVTGLTATNWYGGAIQGAGRLATQIVNNVSGSNVLTTNGCQYMNFSDLGFSATGAGICIDLDWNGAGGTTALQSNNFYNCLFNSGAQGVRLGQSGNMGSENNFFGCYFINFTTAALNAVGFNALQNGLFGGNIQNCAIGVWMQNGSFQSIHNVGFQLSTDFDIRGPSANINGLSVIGCRTESSNFVRSSARTVIVGCSQQSAVRGIFFEGSGGTTHISGCVFDGKLVPSNGNRLTVQDSTPISTVSGDWLSLLDPTTMVSYGSSNPLYCMIELENICGLLSDFSGDAGAQIVKERIYTLDAVTLTTEQERIRLTANRTFYVSTAGSDVTGVGASGAPWATLQHAIDYISQKIDLATFTATIQLAAGAPNTYAGATINDFVGGGSILIQSSDGVIANTTINTSINFNGDSTTAVGIGGMTLSSSTDSNILIDGDRTVYVGTATCPNIGFGTVGNGASSVRVNDHGTFSDFGANVTITPGIPTWNGYLDTDNNCNVRVYGASYTIVGTPAIDTAFLVLSTGTNAQVNIPTVTGTATGITYIIGTGAVISTINALANIPGNAPGIFGGCFLNNYVYARPLIEDSSALVDGATPALNASLGNIFTLSAAGDRTIAVPTNPVTGQKIVIRHFASGGARTLSLNTGAGGFRFGSTITGLTQTASGKTDYIDCIWNESASFWDVIAYVKGY